MKVYLIVGLLFIGVNAEKKINLEDIERDNLRAESASQDGNAQATKYSINSDINQQQYQISSKYNAPNSLPITYATPPSIQNVPSEMYQQANRYTFNEQAYQQQDNVLPEQVVPPQYYQYQQQVSVPPKRVVPNVYEHQQVIYNSEVPVGNRLQSVQQKAASAKYSKNLNRETVYVNIPMMHLLTYYPNLDINSGRSSGLLTQPGLNTAANEQLSIPLYTSAINQKPIIPTKPTYQVQYGSKYSTTVPVVFTTKVTKGTAYTTPVAPPKVTNSPVIDLPSYNQVDQSFAQGRQFLYTQAYSAPSKPQYIPQFVYAQPTTVYLHATPVYSDIYAREPTYLQDNSLHGNVKYSPAPEQLDTAPPHADEQPKEVLGQENSQTVSQNYVEQDAEEPNTELVPPQLPAQDFKSESTPLEAVPSREEDVVPVQNHVGSSEPRSLLESYVPSKIIAAQDFIRYQERPIKLESGFLPSKENFLHKKRKTN